MSRLRWILLVLLATIGGSAAAAAPASATLKLTWWECKKISGGPYKNPFCSEDGPPHEYNWEQVDFGVLLSLFTYMTWKLESKVAGAKITIECKKGNGEGWLENPKAGSPGIDYSENKLSECSVSGVVFAGCKVSGTPTIKANTKLSEISGKAADKFTPHEGTTLVSFSLEGCTTTEFNKTYPIGGEFYGIVNSSTSSLTFASVAESGELKFGGNGATLTGTDKIETTGGNGVKVE